MRVIGVDVGSVAVKAVLLDLAASPEGEWVDSALLPTGWDPGKSGADAVAGLLSSAGLTRADVDCVVSTGYGRKLVGADASLTEISCHALGVGRLFAGRGIRTVLDIGGQDSKVIALDAGGGVENFLMNDKCAAGTGRFLQNMAVMLGMTLDDLNELPDAEPQVISSMCTVFAESEVVGRLAQGVAKEALALGVLDAVASRAEGMLHRVGLRPAVAFTGGPARNRSLVRFLERRLEQPVLVSPRSQFAGALGAAESARRKL